MGEDKMMSKARLKGQLALCVGILLCFSYGIYAQEQATFDGDRPNLNDRLTIIVRVDENAKITLNNEEFGTAGKTYCLSGRLLELFKQRKDILLYKVGMENRPDLPVDERIDKTVWVVASSSLRNEQITDVINALKLAGASPVKMLTEGSYKFLVEHKVPACAVEAEDNGTGRFISGGIINSKAISLPRPVYPPIARAADATGTVNVAVTIDENGNVVSAKATSGHPLLQQAAVNAACQAKFSPTLLSGQPVRVKGTLVFKFPPKE